MTFLLKKRKAKSPVRQTKPEIDMATVPRMEGTTASMHGLLGKEEWANPYLAAASDQLARPNQGNTIKANEYLDEPDVLDAKLDIVANLIKKSKHMVVYSGAGLSRASGIADYATRASNSVAGNGIPRLANNMEAQPNYGHYAIAALEKAGYVKYYVQQNHDGLPQKAGYPQEKMNEVHGAWYDPSNRVVQFNEELRSDIFHEMLKCVELKEDFCLCVGTSLSGMNADRVARTCAKRMKKGKKGYLGTVIVNLQKTGLDDISAIRIWARIDDAMRILTEKLAIDVPQVPLPAPVESVFTIPYNSNGCYDPTYAMKLDLTVGAKVRICIPEAKNRDSTGWVEARDKEGNWVVALQHEKNPKRHTNHILGRWWVIEALNGALPTIPIVNMDAEVEEVADPDR